MNEKSVSLFAAVAISFPDQSEHRGNKILQNYAGNNYEERTST